MVVLSELGQSRALNGYIQIWNVGKRLIDYKMMKQPGQKAARTQGTGIETLKEYLKTQKAVLVNAPPV
jgi:hypothetical protein